MAAVVPSSHGGDCGGDPPGGDGNWQPQSGCAASGAKEGRKKNKNLSLKAAAKKSSKELLDIDFEKGQRGTYIAVGVNSDNFNSLVGTIISKIPYYFPSWASIPSQHTCTIYDELQAWYDVDSHIYGPQGKFIKIGLNKYFAKIYRDQKYKFSRTHFEARGGVKNGVALRTSPPGNVSADYWEKFVDFKLSDAFQKRSAANKKCRSKQTIKVRHGRKNGAQIRFNNKGVSPIDLYKRHRTKKGRFTEPEAEELHMRMEEMKNDPNCMLTEEEIMEEVLQPRRGWTRGYGPKLPQSAFVCEASCSRSQRMYTLEEMQEYVATYTAPLWKKLGMTPSTSKNANDEENDLEDYVASDDEEDDGEESDGGEDDGSADA